MNLLLWIAVVVLSITLVFGWGFLLWVIAEIGSKLFNIIGLFYSIVYSLFSLKWRTGRKKINAYFYAQALSKDQHSNVVLSDFFNRIMLKKRSVKFGDPDETLSWYFAVNKLLKDRSAWDCGLTKFGSFWASFLNLFERSKGGHLNVAIEKKMMKEDAVLKKHSYITHPDLTKYKDLIVKEFENNIEDYY